MRPTRKSICAGVLHATGDKVELDKFEGVYYWCVPMDEPSFSHHPIGHFEESCTHFTRLPSVERMVEDYVSKKNVFLKEHS